MSRVLPYNAKQWEIPLLLDGRKTVTRRVIKPQPKMPLSYIFAGCNYGKWTYPPKDAWEVSKWGEKYKWTDDMKKEDAEARWTPPYHTDDIIYVRETWQECCRNHVHNPIVHSKYCYKASLDCVFYGCIEECGDICKWRPSIHMPKEAARIWLKVTDVRVERLQDISGGELLKEGIDKSLLFDGNVRNAFDEFAKLWDSTIKKPDLDRYGWNATPLVWAIEFERCEKLGLCTL